MNHIVVICESKRLANVRGSHEDHREDRWNGMIARAGGCNGRRVGRCGTDTAHPANGGRLNVARDPGVDEIPVAPPRVP